MPASKVIKALTKNACELWKALTVGFPVDIVMASGKGLQGDVFPGGSGPFAVCPRTRVASAHYSYREDFDAYDHSNSPTFGLEATEVGSGSAAIATLDAVGGQVTVTSVDADNDGCTFYKLKETVKCETGRALWAAWRVKLSSATQSDMFVGLYAYEADLQDVSDNMPSDGFGFRKDDGDTVLDICSSKNGTNTASTGKGTLDTDWHEYAFHWDGAGTLTFYLDGTSVGTVTTNICDDETLTPVVMFRNGEAAAITATLDYVTLDQPREVTA